MTYRVCMRWVFLAMIVFVLFGCCGYTNKAVVANNARTIAVETFKNKLDMAKTFTYEAGLEIDITNEVIDRFTYDGNLKIVPVDKADLVLQGALTSYDQESVRYQDHGDVKEYRMHIGVDLVLIDQRTGETLWEEKGFTGRTEYVRDGLGSTTERSAATDARADLAKKIVDRVVEDW